MKWVCKSNFKFGKMFVWKCGERFVPFPEYDEKRSSDPNTHYEVADTRSGGKKIVYSNKQTDGWIAWINSLGRDDRGSHTGEVLADMKQEGMVEVLVGSRCRTNDEWEYIIKAQEGVMLYIHPKGRASNYYLLFGKDKVEKIYAKEENLHIDDNNLSDDFFKKNWLNLNCDYFKIK